MQIHALEGDTAQQLRLRPDGPVRGAFADHFESRPGGRRRDVQRDVRAARPAATKQPVANGARNVWVTETALTTALNTSYMAAQLGLFAIVVGFALLLAGIGFGILAIGGALRNPENIRLHAFGKGKAVGQAPAPAA